MDTATATLVPGPEALPDVLPNSQLNERGMARRPLRDDLRRIQNGRNVLTVLLALVQSLGVVAGAAYLNAWWAYLVAFIVMARGHVCLNILAHEAAHRLLFTNQKANDLVGRWLLGYPSFQAMLAYRRAHFTHHRDEMGPEEPDAGYYAGYPLPKESWRRKLRRDLFGISAYKNFRTLVRAARHRRTEAMQILGLHTVGLALTVAAGRPIAYLVWIGSWSSLWRVSNRLRSVAEHGGLVRSQDRRMTSHVIKQSALPRFWMVPYNTGWHLAHHVDMGVPWRNLPRFHAMLVDAGWVNDALTYPSYRKFWRAATAGTGSATQISPVDGRSSMMDFDD